jgi:hypothetical protein
MIRGVASSGSAPSSLVSLGTARLGPLGAARLAGLSRAWAAPAPPRVDALDALDAALVVATAAEEVGLLGAFQRPSELDPASAPARLRGPTWQRRGSGGGPVLLRPGSLWVQLRLRRADVPGDKLLNRYVRPLLAALTRLSGVPVSYFGRDWVAARHAPIAAIGFAHDAGTGEAAVEAFVGLGSPAFPLALARPSFRGKQPCSLEEAAGRPVDAPRAVDAIVEAYAALAGATVEWEPPPVEEASERDEPPWLATRPEAIGLVGAGPDSGGVLRLGGELMASVDVVERLGRDVAELPGGAGPDAVGGLVDAAFAAPPAMLFGVRSLLSLRDVLFEARQNMA